MPKNKDKYQCPQKQTRYVNKNVVKLKNNILDVMLPPPLFCWFVLFTYSNTLSCKVNNNDGDKYFSLQFTLPIHANCDKYFSALFLST